MLGRVSVFTTSDALLYISHLVALPSFTVEIIVSIRIGSDWKGNGRGLNYRLKPLTWRKSNPGPKISEIIFGNFSFDSAKLFICATS
jgi:hypothetical protein